MAETNNDKLFRTKVLPIMNKVMRDLRLKQSEEMAIHTSSLPYIMAGAAGPDGGMSAQAASLASLRYTGKWNSKHTEDYVQMVKDELKKQHIAVTPEIEKMMIEKMIKDEIPKSSIDYIMRKAATNTIFYLPQALNKSPLENHITAQAEKRYNPSTLEKGTGYVLGAAADYMTMGGIGGSWSGAAKFVGVDLALNAAIDKVGAKETDDVPLIIAPEHRAEYKATQAKRNQEQPKPKPKENTPTVERTTETQVQPVKEQKEVAQTQPEAQQEQPQQTNQNGWSGLLSSVGLNGISDIGHNLGYVLAMLPDMLVGIFTGKTKSLGLKDNMLPLASIVAGMFVRNPILKMVLIGMGGLNLLNKAGHEALDNHKGVSYGQGGNANVRGNYKVYEDETLNARISQPQIKGNCLIATIDKVPCTIALPDRVVDAYNQGALPLNTLANAVLAKNDQMRQIAAENYAASEQQAQTRTLAQR
ncbi:hypothetical protein [Prevotella sp. P5-64]|uniref:hypothetical protein n=1 Tax=Prevotella sp. P5-64 TaxID=2024226 RepID=UPI000B9735FB|nr:hypothetical protein [Prevotella sp. P5-64]OYP68734.1 hypothetical protein CIK87_06960 [Prevotella sp. P5-64]